MREPTWLVIWVVALALATGLSVPLSASGQNASADISVPAADTTTSPATAAAESPRADAANSERRRRNAARPASRRGDTPRDNRAGSRKATLRRTRAVRRPEDVDLFYVSGQKAMLYNRPDSTAPVGELDVRAPVTRIQCPGFWCKVRTERGRTGYLARHAISNVWIRVAKRERRVYVYRGPHLKHVFKADFGYNAFSDKRQRGSTRERDHWRTPEGTFYVVRRNPNSQFHKALVLNYPKVEDARRGLETGLISRSQYEAIKRAQDEQRMPPMDTDLGGWIEIHGDGTGDATAWTQGCVAVRNSVMDALWTQVRVGTPVLVE